MLLNQRQTSIENNQQLGNICYLEMVEQNEIFFSLNYILKINKNLTANSTLAICWGSCKLQAHFFSGVNFLLALAITCGAFNIYLW
jgi:hypothetical protein